MSTRRDVLMGAALLPASVIGIEPSIAEGSGETRVAQANEIKIDVPHIEVQAIEPTPPPPETNGPSFDDIYRGLKERLSKSGKWPDSFNTSFEKEALDGLIKVANQEKGGLTHNARLVEPLLGEIASLLERSYKLREEGRQLEIAGVSAGAADLLLENFSTTDVELAKLDLLPEAAAVLAKYFPEAAAKFSTANDMGSAIQANAQGAANQVLRDGQEKRLNLSVGRLLAIQDIQKEFAARHQVKGNADNYAERFDFLRGLFVSDILAAYRRAFAAASGLRSIFDHGEALPEPTEHGFVEKMIAWTRDAMRETTRIGESEIELIKRVVVDFPASSKTAVFSFPKLEGLKHIRLQSVGASFQSNPAGTPNLGNSRFAMVLLPNDTVLGKRPVIPIPAARHYSSSQPVEYVDGALLYNVDPQREWTVYLNRLGHDDNGPVDRGDNLQRIHFHFRILAVPNDSKEPTFWTDKDLI